jgi:hypothetical protein
MRNKETKVKLTENEQRNIKEMSSLIGVEPAVFMRMAALEKVAELARKFTPVNCYEENKTA